jgi:anti-anti-sigma factor
MDNGMTNTIRMPKRFDYSASGEFNAALNSVLNENISGQKIVLDCAQLDYIDSAGIGLLVMSHKKVQSHRASFIMINAKSSAKEILMLANLQKLIEIK